jgi:hypothetical protein
LAASGVGRKFALCQLIFASGLQKIVTKDKIQVVSLSIPVVRQGFL